MTTPRLLLVEDDPDLAGLLTELLTSEGYDVDTAGDGQRGLHLGLTRDYDLMLLARGLPAIVGLDLLTRLRSRGRSTPTLVLSALGNPRDRVEGLDAGAEVALSERESMLLAALARQPRRVLSRAELVDSVFEDAEEEGVVDTYVHYLRRKLGRRVVETVRGVGYRIGRP